MLLQHWIQTLTAKIRVTDQLTIANIAFNSDHYLLLVLVLTVYLFLTCERTSYMART